MKHSSIFLLGLIPFLIIGCNAQKKMNSAYKSSDMLQQEVMEVAKKQLGFQTRVIDESGRFMNPRTVENGFVKYVGNNDWTSGFFPGTLFYMYDLTQDEKWKELGVKYTETLESVKKLTSHHDVGFMINSSFGNALRVTNNESYKDIIIEAAKSLSTRYREGAGVIQSWNEVGGWQGERGWSCPVIIDNMMNLELLMKATQYSRIPHFGT